MKRQIMSCLCLQLSYNFSSPGKCRQGLVCPVPAPLLPTQAPALLAPCRSLPDTPLHTCFSSESAESSPLDHRGAPDICISNQFLHDVENQRLRGSTCPYVC